MILEMALSLQEAVYSMYADIFQNSQNVVEVKERSWNWQIILDSTESLPTHLTA